MGSNNNGQAGENQFALVSYIAPDPLGKFLDRLRLDLVPKCRPHAHVTILPPRLLTGTAEQAKSELRKAVGGFQSFEVELGAVELFGATDVVYLEVTRGERELREMHDWLNRGAAWFSEPYEFHPHITLVQNLGHELVSQALEEARRVWEQWRGSRSFRVEELVFVENVGEVWRDLAHLPLVHQPAGIMGR